VAARPPQVAQVVFGVESPVQHGDDPAQLPAHQILLHLFDHRDVCGVARPHPAAHRDTVPGDGQADHSLRQVRPVVLGVPTAPQAAILILIFVLGLKVGGGGVEVKDVYFQVEQVSHGRINLLLQFGFVLQKKVHRPVELLQGYFLYSRDHHVLFHPFFHSSLGQGIEGAVRCHGKKGSFYRGLVLPLLEQGFKYTFDPQLFPEPVQEPGSSQWTAGDKFQEGCSPSRFMPQDLLGPQEPVDALYQTL
jgi:hypothetical protein